MERRRMVFGIGLSKSGTTSLDGALATLGLRSLHYPSPELMVAGRYAEALDRCDAATDITVSAFFRQLDAAYPGSRFVLTVRELESWLESIEYHFAARDNSKYLGDSPAGLVRELVYGCRAFDRVRFIDAYYRHHGEVVAYFDGRPGDLLIMDVCAGEGWEKLCPFLGLPVPSVPFPHLHKRRTAAA